MTTTVATRTEFIAASILKIDQNEPGVYSVTEVHSDDAVHQPPTDGVQGRKEFSWSFGPVKVTGYIDTDKKEIGVTVSVLGIKIGTFYGSFEKGIGINIDLFLVKGEIRFYIKNGHELWVRLSLTVAGKEYKGDYKIISF